MEDRTAAELADYLTYLELGLYRAIQPWEFLNQAWQREDKQSLAPNLCALISRFNQVQEEVIIIIIIAANFLFFFLLPIKKVSNWVASQVVLATEFRGAKVISLFIETAKRLFDMNNYNTLMEILSGLNNANVSRLKSLWVVCKKYEKPNVSFFFFFVTIPH